jgi:hypothetical protein
MLLSMREIRDQEWAPDTLARMVHADPVRVRIALVSLSRTGLLDRLHGGQSSAFQFKPHSGIARSVEQLARLYLNERAPIVTLIEAETNFSEHRENDSPPARQPTRKM